MHGERHVPDGLSTACWATLCQCPIQSEVLGTCLVRGRIADCPPSSCELSRSKTNFVGSAPEEADSGESCSKDSS